MNLYLRTEYKILILGILCMTIVSAVVNHIAFNSATAFFLFQVYGIVIPGMAVLSFFDTNVFTRLERTLICYVSGYFLNIGIYFVTIPFRLNKYIWCPAAVCCLASLGILYKNKMPINSSKDGIEVKEKIAIIVVIILFSFALVCFSGRWSLPNNVNTYNNDLMYWIGDIIALKERFLPVNMRSLSPNYKYHYFGAMQQAVISIFSSTSAFETAVYWSVIESSIIMGLASSCLTFRIIKNARIGFFTIGLLLFSTGMEKRSVVTYIWHIHLMPMSFNIALSFEMVIMLLIVIQEDLKKLNCKLLILLTICMAICTGTKGPVGAIALCGTGIVCLYWMFGKREYPKAWVYGCASLAAFGIIYFVLLADTNRLYEMHADNALVDESYENVDGSVTRPGREDICNTIMKLGKTFKAYLAYAVYTNPWTVVPSFLLIVYEFLCRKENILHWAMAGMIIIGIILGKKVQYIGASQMYFTMAVFPFAAILTGKLLECALINKRNSVVINENVLSVLFIIVMGVIVTYSVKWTYDDSLRASIHIGWGNLTHTPYKVWGGGSKQEVSIDEYNAYTYLRKHTKTDTAALIDPSLEATEYGYKSRVFSERFIYYYKDVNDINELKVCTESVYKKSQKDIRYIILNKEMSIIPENLLGKQEPVYENDKIIIYYIE